MAMGMNQYSAKPWFETEKLGFGAKQIFEKALKQKAPARNPLPTWQAEFLIILDKHRLAGRLQKQNGRVVHVQIEECQVVAPKLSGSFQISLAEGWSAAAFSPGRQLHSKASRIQNFDGG